MTYWYYEINGIKGFFAGSSFKEEVKIELKGNFGHDAKIERLLKTTKKNYINKNI
jgi:hypothetical protein